jgi:hypothetical protein
MRIVGTGKYILCTGHHDFFSLPQRERLEKKLAIVLGLKWHRAHFSRQVVLSRPWKSAWCGLWSQGQTSRASMEPHLIKEADDA